MALWLAASFPALILVLSFHVIDSPFFSFVGSGYDSLEHPPNDGQRTMVLWLPASFPALILVLSFITILLRARTFETFGA